MSLKPTRTWSITDLGEAMKGKGREECAGLERQWFKAHGHGPEDFYSPRVAAQRFEAGLRACMGVPPTDEKEKRLRCRISNKLERDARAFKRKKR